MKLEHLSPNQGPTETLGRKTPLWSREKISQLIELYKKHECLWNHWHESYKCKDKRNRAIEEICSTLHITKFDFGRKIHNLRNQFNTEMKKLEQRVGEAGESVDESSTALRCKWNHFESLMFLRNVIEPRPGGYQSTYQAPKKMRLRFDYNSAEDDVNVTMLPSNTNSSSASGFHNDDISQYQQCEDNDNEEVATEEYHNFEQEITEVVHPPAREETYDQKYQPPAPQHLQQQHAPITTLNTSIAPNPRAFVHSHTSHKTSQPTQTHIATPHAPAHISTNSSPHTEVINLSNEDASLIELNSNNLTVITSTSSAPVVHTNTSTNSSGSCSIPLATAGVNNTVNKPPMALPAVRDQWDAFGELVACEFRNLNSDVSRKKLKRKIMLAMLEVGEEDDAL